jgi:hypothetical protein
MNEKSREHWKEWLWVSSFIPENLMKRSYLLDLGLNGSIILTLRRLMSYIYGAPILDVSRSHTTTQHSR